MSDVRVCKLQTDCDTYHWRSGIWSACVVRNSSNCGVGLRTREAACVVDNSAMDILGRVVPDWRCHGLLPPVKEEACSKPCPKDCQLTPWSEWTSCQDNCASLEASSPTQSTSTAASFTVIMNTQSRYRRVLQWPSHGGQECPRLIDVRPCPLQQSSQSCEARSWRPQPWSKCLLPEGKSCGEGIRVRSLDCISAGAKVDMKECLEMSMPLQHERCSLDCVSQCVTGPWSSWTACGLECPSRRSRSRSISNKVECEKISSVEHEMCPCQKYR